MTFARQKQSVVYASAAGAIKSNVYKHFMNQIYRAKTTRHKTYEKSTFFICSGFTFKFHQNEKMILFLLVVGLWSILVDTCSGILFEKIASVLVPSDMITFSYF